MTPDEIISKLPYSEPFLFVDEIEKISEEGIVGSYTFRKDAGFYRGHFKNFPVTPGVILTECMCQIGLVCLGIFLNSKEKMPTIPKIALAETAVEFYLPVFPGEKIRVVSKKKYFRFNKLKCEVIVFNNAEKRVCKGTISGMIKTIGQ